MNGKDLTSRRERTIDMLESDSFESLFEKLTGFQPQCRQKRSYHKYFLSDLPRVIDLPTGLGKTMIMAIWLIARIKHPEKIPTRLIYVVDRRTVVDQAIAMAKDADLKGKRVVVFFRQPEDTIEISEIIKQPESRGKNPGPYACSVEVLTGTMRGLEQDELFQTTVAWRAAPLKMTTKPIKENE